MYIFKAQFVQSIKNQFRNCQSSNDGGLITIRQSIFNDSQSVFIGNKGFSGGVIQSQGSQITITGSTFTNNSAETGGVFLVTESSLIKINNSKFQYNKASYQGGVLTAQTNSQMILLNSRFLENESEGDNSVLEILSSSRTDQVQIINCTFSENIAEKNTISLMYSQAIIQNSKFINNYAKSRTKNIFLGFTNLTILNCQFDQSFKIADLSTSQIIGTYIFVIFDVNLIIQSSTFKNGLSSQGGAVYIYGDSSVQIGASYFTNNYANLEGGAIYSSGFNLLSIVNNTKFYNNFANNEGDDIYVTNTKNKFQLYDTSIQNQIGKSSISVQLANVEIINVTIRDLQYLAKLNSGGALKCVNCKALLIKNTIIKNVSSQIGGAVYLSEEDSNKVVSSSSYRYLIQNSSISQSQSVVGGAIYISNVQSLRITKTNFTQNSATNKYTLETSQTEGSGGVIYHTCDSTSLNCKLDISQGNIFKDNFAAVQGGAIYWDTVEPIFSLNQSTYNNNNAGLYGNNIACFAQEMIQITQEIYSQQITTYSSSQSRLLNMIQDENYNFSNTRLEYDIHEYQGNYQRFLASQLLIENQRSGGSIPTTYMALVDKYGQILGSNSNSKIQVFVNATYNSNPKANVYPPVIEGQNQFTSSFGVFVIEDLIFDASPGYSYSVVVQSDAIDVTKQSNKEYMKNLNRASLNLDLLISLRECQIGEQFTIAGKCEECQNSFSLDLQNSPGSCKTCPYDKAICSGGSKIYPLPGYWRKSNTTSTIIACMYLQACLGTQNEQQSAQGECALGYQGVLCADCQTGFSRSGEFRCSQCPERILNIVRLSFIVAGVFFLFVFLIRSTLNSASDKNNITNIYFKILINHFQLIMMTATFDINWTDEIKGFFSETKQVATVSSQVFSIDCFLDNRYEDPNSQQGGEDPQIRIFFVKLVMIAVFPILLIIGCFIIWSAIKLILKRKINIKNSITSSVVIALFLAHSSIVQYMFYDFKCKKVDDQERVLNDLEVVCWDVQHTIYSYFVALPSILVWGLGTPLFAFSLLLKNKDKLDTLVIREQYGFIYRGYKQSFYFWEIIIIYRKILIIFIAIFIKTAGVIAQTLFVLIVLIIRRALNNLESLSLIASMFTLYFGLFFLVDKPQSWVDSNPDYADGAVVLNSYVKKLFFALILLFNIGFFIYWCLTISIELHDKLILKYTKIYLCLCLCNNEAVLEKAIIEHQRMQDNENYLEQLQILSRRLQKLYQKGKLALNQKSVERLDLYFAEDKILQVAGKNREEYYEKYKKRTRSKRVYHNQNKNVFLSQMTQQDNKTENNDQLYEEDSQYSKSVESSINNKFITGQEQLDKILQLLEDETNYEPTQKNHTLNKSNLQILKKQLQRDFKNNSLQTLNSITQMKISQSLRSKIIKQLTLMSRSQEKESRGNIDAKSELDLQKQLKRKHVNQEESSQSQNNMQQFYSQNTRKSKYDNQSSLNRQNQIKFQDKIDEQNTEGDQEFDNTFDKLILNASMKQSSKQFKNLVYNFNDDYNQNDNSSFNDQESPKLKANNSLFRDQQTLINDIKKYERDFNNDQRINQDIIVSTRQKKDKKKIKKKFKSQYERQNQILNTKSHSQKDVSNLLRKLHDYQNEEVSIDLNFNQYKISALSYLKQDTGITPSQNQATFVHGSENYEQSQDGITSQDRIIKSSSQQSFIEKTQTPQSQDQPQVKLSKTDLDQEVKNSRIESRNSYHPQQQQTTPGDHQNNNKDKNPTINSQLSSVKVDQEATISYKDADQRVNSILSKRDSNSIDGLQEISSQNVQINNDSIIEKRNSPLEQSRKQFLNKLTDIELSLNLKGNSSTLNKEHDLQPHIDEEEQQKIQLERPPENFEQNSKTNDDEEEKFNNFLDQLEKEKKQKDEESINRYERNKTPANIIPKLNLRNDDVIEELSNDKFSEYEEDTQPHQQMNFDFLKEPDGQKNQELESNFAQTQRGFDPKPQIKSTIGTPRNLNLYGSMVFNQNKLDRSQQDLKLKNNLQSYQNSMPNSSRGITSRSNQVLLFNKDNKDNQIDQIQKNNYINEESGDEEDLNKKTKKSKKQAKRKADDMSKYQTYTNPDQALKKTIENMTKKNYIKDKFINDKRNTANKFI
eukprot:403366626